jgi:3'(2'), 5'-bisphosphate nucleotidase
MRMNHIPIIPSVSDADALARAFGLIAVKAGRLIMDVFERGCAVMSKADGSTLTEADQRAESAILQGLHELLPGVQVVGEEATCACAQTRIADEFILVDALDGTAEFVARRPEFTVNIALVSHGKPTIGCIYSPASRELYLGGRVAFAARVAAGSSNPDEFRIIAARPRPSAMVAAISRSHLDARTKDFLAERHILDRLSVGSSIKFCRIAEGKADIYPRFGPTMEWDVAAGHAILNAAGGQMLTPEETPFRYGKIEKGFTNGPFIAWGSPSA